MQDINNIIESLLFVAEEPLTLEKLKGILGTVEAREIKSSLQDLADQYEARGGGFKLYEVAGGWQLRSRPEYNEWIKRMLQPSPQRLSKPSLETLAIVAYNQPIIRADIEHIRGVDCGGVLRQLMERKLIRVLGRKEIPGRPLIYATTRLFLELFGLKDLKDLPSPKEIEEMASAMEESNAAGSAGIDQQPSAEGYQDAGELADIWAEVSLTEPAGQALEQTTSILRVAAEADNQSIWETTAQVSLLHLKPPSAIGAPPPGIGRQLSRLPGDIKNNTSE